MRIIIDDLVFNFKFRDGGDSENFPATMTLKIGQFEIKGFTVRKTKYDDNEEKFVLFPPANRSGKGKWIKIFFTEIKEDWEKLEKNALEQFNKEHNDHLLKLFGDLPAQNNGNKEEINIEKIEF